MAEVFVRIDIDSKGVFSNVEVSGKNVQAVVKAVKVLGQEFMPEVGLFGNIGKVISRSKSK